MTIEQARVILSSLILHIGRQGRPVGFWEVAFKLGYSEEDVSEAINVLESHGVLRRCDTADSTGFTLDSRYVADTMQTLVAEDKLVSFTAGGKVHYFSPEG